VNDNLDELDELLHIIMLDDEVDDDDDIIDERLDIVHEIDAMLLVIEYDEIDDNDEQ
jgi:hypothetical protein